MKNFYKLGLTGILCGAIVGFTAPIFAQVAAPAVAPTEEEGQIASFFKSVEVSGFIDTYYSYNYSRPNDRRGTTFGRFRDGGRGHFPGYHRFCGCKGF